MNPTLRSPLPSFSHAALVPTGHGVGGWVGEESAVFNLWADFPDEAKQWYR